MPYNEDICIMLTLHCVVEGSRKSSGLPMLAVPKLPDLSLGADCTWCQKTQEEEPRAEISGQVLRRTCESTKANIQM